MDLNMSEVVCPAIGVADDLKSSISAEGVIDLPNSKGLLGGWFTLWICWRKEWDCGWVAVKAPMFLIGVEFNDIDLNVLPDAMVMGVESCFEWCIAGDNIDILVATEDNGAGGGGGAGNNRAPEENDGVDVCRMGLDSAAKWDKVLLCKIAVEEEDGVPTKDIW